MKKATQVAARRVGEITCGNAGDYLVRTQETTNRFDNEGRMVKHRGIQSDDKSFDLNGRQNPDASLLNTFVGYNLRRAAAKQRERFRSVFDAYDIRPVQLTILTLLLENMPLRQSELG